MNLLYVSESIKLKMSLCSTNVKIHNVSIRGKNVMQNYFLCCITYYLLSGVSMTTFTFEYQMTVCYISLILLKVSTKAQGGGVKNYKNLSTWFMDGPKGHSTFMGQFPSL